MAFGAREEQVERLGCDQFDVAIVGGGITGAGIALDLSARGQRVALVERDDFASGTSSRSSKLIHGGLRYLANFQVGVTREALRERAILLRLAPSLVEQVPFVLPVTTGLVEAARIAVGLTLYDLLAGRANVAPWTSLDRAALRHIAPGLDLSRVTVAYVYHDCRTDDARLTLRVLREAHRRGTVLANRVEALAIRHGNGPANGLRIRDRLTGRETNLDARRVVLATGAWGEGPLALDSVTSRTVRPSKGIHLFLSADRLPVRTALYLPTGVDDRLVFVVPWQGRILVGTTDTDYDGPLDRPAPQAADAAYLLGVLNRSFPGRTYTTSDVVGAQAGVRPLLATAGDTVSASREERVWQRSDGVVAIAGGKLTTYRRMAEKVAAALDYELDHPRGRPTEAIPIAPHFDDPDLRARLAAVGVGACAADRLLRVYGSDAAIIAQLAAERPDLAIPMVPGQLPILAEALFAARQEQARAVVDVLERRTRLLLLDGAGARAAAPRVAAVLGGNEASLLSEFERDAEQYRLA